MNVLKPEKRAEVVKLLGQGLSINQIHARAGVSGFTIAKIKAADPKLAAMPSKRGGAPAHKTAATKARVATPGVAASDSDKLAAKLIGSLEAERDKLVEELRLISTRSCGKKRSGQNPRKSAGLNRNICPSRLILGRQT